MSCIGGQIECPNCKSDNVKPGKSGGMICHKCGTWF